ncbi:MAG TPA: hypothetical protein VGL89_01785 [Candidatus Koribacter sp.]|jgi:hypothetical protein
MGKSPLQESAATLANEIEAFLKERDAGTPMLEYPYICSDLDGRPLENDAPIWEYEFQTLKQFRLRFEARIDALWEEHRTNPLYNMYFKEAVRMLKTGLPIKTQELFVFPVQLKRIAGD